MRVTGLDTDSAAVIYAHQQHDRIDYIQGMMQELPFDTAIFDYCAAVTSLCFVSKPENSIREMWRVCRRGVVLGLLNRHSLLYWQKKDRGGYRGARWDTPAEVDTWLRSLQPVPQVQFATAVYLPGGGMLARWLENAYSSSFLWGSFLAVYLEKS